MSCWVRVAIAVALMYRKPANRVPEIVKQRELITKDIIPTKQHIACQQDGESLAMPNHPSSVLIPCSVGHPTNHFDYPNSLPNLLTQHEVESPSEGNIGICGANGLQSAPHIPSSLPFAPQYAATFSQGNTVPYNQQWAEISGDIPTNHLRLPWPSHIAGKIPEIPPQQNICHQLASSDAYLPPECLQSTAVSYGLTSTFMPERHHLINQQSPNQQLLSQENLRYSFSAPTFYVPGLQADTSSHMQGGKTLDPYYLGQPIPSQRPSLQVAPVQSTSPFPGDSADSKGMY